MQADVLSWLKGQAPTSIWQECPHCQKTGTSAREII